MNERFLDESLWPAGMGEPLRVMLRNIIARLREVPGILGCAAGGSFITGGMDAFSDLDLVLAVDLPEWKRVMESRKTIAQSLGPLLASFTGEHVGEPRLLICLFGPPPVHVDLKFVTLEMLETRVEDPAVLWDRSGAMSDALRNGTARFPEPCIQWIEDRIWAWVHYAAAKIGRGELFEALHGLMFISEHVLGPLALSEAAARPTGVRHIEQAAPAFASRLKSTIARYDARDALRALRAVVELYRGLRDKAAAFTRGAEAEAAVMDYLETVSAGIERA
jgi:hypothetical protein